MRQRYSRRLALCIVIAGLLSPWSPSIQAAGTSGASAPQTTIEQSAAWSCRGVYHVVRRGETIYSIARRYGASAYRIAVCNGLASYTVYVGQALLVPTSLR